MPLAAGAPEKVHSFLLAGDCPVEKGEPSVKTHSVIVGLLLTLACNTSCTTPPRPHVEYESSFLPTRVPDIKLDDVSVLGETSTLVLPISTPLPFYPFGLLRSGVGGAVELVLTVDEKGDVARSRVSKGGNRELEEASLRAVENWKFFRRDLALPKEAAPSGIEVSCRISFATLAPE